MRETLITMFIIFLICSCIVLGIVSYIPERQMRESFQVIFATFETTTKTAIVVIGVTIGLALLIGLIWLVWVAYQSGIVWHSLARFKRAEALQAERNASLLITVAPPGSQVYATEVRNGLDLVHKPLYLTAGEEPTLDEIRRWFSFQQAHSINRKPSITIEELPQLPAPVSLLDSLDSVQRCLIVGASDAGKTTLLQHIISRRLITSKVIVIDPHAYPNKWPTNCVIVGTGRDYEKINNALDALVRLMTKRYDEISKGSVAEMGHSKITIIIDEWRAIVSNLGKPASEAIKALLTESRKAASSVFVATHSDRAKPLGLEGEYDLKDGFAVVRLSLVNRQRQATLDTGNGPIPVILPGPYTNSQPQVIEEVIDLQPELDDTEAKILQLKAEGKSNREISQAVWGDGKFGDFYNRKIEQVLQKFGEN